MEREQFTFYSSFAKAIQRIRKPAERCAAYDAIINYALYEKEPDFDTMPDTAAIAFEVIKPNLDASRRKAENGKKGGNSEANRKQNEANDKQTEANSKQIEATSDSGKQEQEQIESKNKIKDKGKNKSKIKDKCPLSPLPPSSEYSDEDFGNDMLTMALGKRSQKLISTVNQWLQYKREKRSTYKQTGLNMLVNKINRMVDQYGEDAVINVIEESMGRNYQGIVWDWLTNESNARKPGSAEDMQNKYRMMQEWADGT